ncbi:MAG: YaaL family protein [Lachnospiraceae bacterium]|nr:YaaL family protein [Lachnospiraceae bacterium]
MRALFSQNRPQNIPPIEEELGCPSLQESIEKTRGALEAAYAGFDNAVEPDLIDCYIYEINAQLKKYKYLSDLAAHEHSLQAAAKPEASDQKSSVRALVGHVFG